ncbi:hypothetical protein HIJ39_22570 [Sulfobacillus sp. DSM 109850]|uniref:Uncharacterized protein n=2 Tax=Sulfobacillus harzensis TaxID=2729629 RepID=A0A7Y0LAX5_9FIRM|nr:hypothetical protein [Sulfobacillus harzensis]
MPTVSEETHGRWEVRLSTLGGRVLNSHGRPLTAYPPGRQSKLRMAVDVFDPLAHTAHVLHQLGIQTSFWDGSTPILHPLVVGEGIPLTSALWESIRQATHQGIPVLVLAQPPGWTGGPNLAVDHQVITTSFPRALHHGVFAGMADGGLSWWRGAHEVVAEGLLPKPRSAHALVIADGGQALGGATLLCWQDSLGPVWFCQYPVVARSAEEPMAAMLLDNLMTALSRPPAQREITCWGPIAAHAVQAVGLVPSTDLSIPSSPDGVLLIDFTDSEATEAMADHIDALQQWVRGGGQLWIHGADVHTSPLVSRITGWGPYLVDVPDDLQHSALNTNRTRISDGLSNVDLDWTEDAGMPPLVTKAWKGLPKSAVLVETAAVDWRNYGAKPEQIKTASTLKSQGWPPAAVLWQRQLDHGLVLIDQLHWETSGSLGLTILARIAASLRQKP